MSDITTTFDERTRKRLLEEVKDPNAEGEWEIYGEDPNCDMGGHHHTPYLCTVSGTYKDVVEYALGLRGFYSWGY